MVEEAHDRAYAILQDKRELLNQLSALLIAVETIEGDDLSQYVKGTKPIPEPEEARQQLSSLPDNAARRALESLCDFIADRTS